MLIKPDFRDVEGASAFVYKNISAAYNAWQYSGEFHHDDDDKWEFHSKPSSQKHGFVHIIQLH